LDLAWGVCSALLDFLYSWIQRVRFPAGKVKAATGMEGKEMMGREGREESVRDGTGWINCALSFSHS